MTETSTPLSSAPVIIGATGGSGTRVVARIARRAGYRLGTNLNPAEDALDFAPFYDKWVNRYVGAERRGELLPALVAERMANDFEVALQQHASRLETASDSGVGGWGWKTPRSIYLLPFFHSRFPGMKFIHVVRDGRDMVFSKNQNQLRKHGTAFLTLSERWFESLPIRSMLLWHRVNLRAAAYAETHLEGTYLLIRFEDLCHSPTATTQRLLRFLDCDLDAAEIARVEIAPPASIGRWRKHPAALTAKLNERAAESLRKFAYLERQEPIAFQ